MKNSKKNIVIGVLLVILTTISIDFFSGKLLEKFYESTRSGIAFQENYIMSKSNQDLLIFGSSRAAYHFKSITLMDTLNMSVYNCGREGSGIYYHYGVLLSTLKRYSPKIIVLDIDYRDIYEHEGIFGFDVLKEHAPFYHRISNEFDSLLTLKGTKEKAKLQSSLYRYNSKAFRIVTGNIVEKSVNELGFRVKEGLWTKDIKHLEKTDLKIDQNKIITINKFIKKATDNNIKVIFTVSPYYILMPKGIFDPLEKLTKNNNSLLLNYAQEEIFLNDKSLFNDIVHLNKRGAELYSSLIAKDIKSYLRK